MPSNITYMPADVIYMPANFIYMPTDRVNIPYPKICKIGLALRIQLIILMNTVGVPVRL